MSNTTSKDDKQQGEYYPYLNRDEKIEAYKKAITQSLDLAVHPEHLIRVRSKLNALEKFWKDNMEKEISHDR